MNNTCDQLEAGEESRIAWVRVVPVREADKYLTDKKKIQGKDWTVRNDGKWGQNPNEVTMCKRQKARMGTAKK